MAQLSPRICRQLVLADGGIDLFLIIYKVDGVTELRVLSATSVKLTGLPKHQAKPNLSRHRSRRGSRLEEAESEVGRGKKRETRRQKW